MPAPIASVAFQLFKKGEAVKDYRGPRTSSGIVKYMSNVQEGKEEEETDDEGGGVFAIMGDCLEFLHFF